MKVTITTLKAPWPEGAKVGDVVAFEGPVPAWAAGKCQPRADDAEVDHVYEPPVVVGTGTALPSIDAINTLVTDLKAQLADAERQRISQADTIRQLTDEVKAGVAESRDLGEKLATAVAANSTLTSEKVAAEADAKEAREKLATAEAALAAAPKTTAAKGNAR